MGTQVQQDNPLFILFMKTIVGILIVVLGAILVFGVLEMLGLLS
jgi:hypothetical protein